jgi:hypothetical protein
MEQLFARSGFQAFMFVGAIVIGLLSKWRPENEVLMIRAIVLLALVAIGAFVLKLIFDFIRPQSREQATRDARNLKAQQWPDEAQVRVARGFMILGLLIYMAYHFLDGFVIRGEGAARRVDEILLVRTWVSATIVGFWVFSFADLFRRNYVVVITAAVLIAGAGVGLMLFLAGPDVHFYYEGFIQVIAFAAFAFRLPPRPLALVCGFMMITFVSVSLFQAWNGLTINMTDSQQAVFANNLVSLVTFVTLSLIASAALRPRIPMV